MLLKLLFFCVQAEYGGEVWLGSVTHSPGIADPNQRYLIQVDKRKKESTVGERPVFLGGGFKTGIALAKRVLDTSIHRFTERMREKRIRSWKDLIEQHYLRLVAIMSLEPDPGTPLTLEERRRLKGGKYSQSFGADGVTDQVEAADDVVDGEVDIDGNNSSLVLSGNLQLEPGVAEPTSIKDSELMSDDDDVPAAVLVESTGSGNAIDESKIGAVNQIWNKHSMAGRLRRPVRLMEGKGVLPMLGPNTYWEESFAETVHRNVIEDERRRHAAKLKASRSNHGDATSLEDFASMNQKAGIYYKPQKAVDIVAMKPSDCERTIAERKELFYDLLRFAKQSRKDDD